MYDTTSDGNTKSTLRQFRCGVLSMVCYIMHMISRYGEKNPYVSLLMLLDSQLAYFAAHKYIRMFQCNFVLLFVLFLLLFFK